MDAGDAPVTGPQYWAAETRWLIARALETLDWDTRTPEDAELLGRNLITVGKRLVDASQNWANNTP